MRVSTTTKTILSGLALTAAFATGLACGSLSDALNREECLSQDDCAGGLGCFIPTPTSTDGSAPPPNGLGIGWCLEQPVCEIGVQPYCPCALSASNQPMCTSQSSSGSRLASTVVVCRDPNAAIETLPTDPTALANCWCVPPEACTFE